MPRQRPEQEIQRAVVEYLRLALPGALVFAVPNNPRLPTPGMLAGMADIVVVWSRLTNDTRGLGRDICVAFMEVKAPKGHLGPAQEGFRNLCRSSGLLWACVRSVDEAEAALVAWGWKLRATARGAA